MRTRAAGYSLSFRVADTGMPEPNATTALNPAPSQKKCGPWMILSTIMNDMNSLEKSRMHTTELILASNNFLCSSFAKVDFPEPERPDITIN